MLTAIVARVPLIIYEPIVFAKLCIVKQNLSIGVNVVYEGSPSRILIVRRISLGITTRPRSSILRTIPVAFIYKFSFVDLITLLLSVNKGVLYLILVLIFEL